MNPQNKPHPHAELIHAWADGKTIQTRLKESQEKWKDFLGSNLPLFNDKHFEYRIKPSNEPWKPKEGERYFYLDIVDGEISVDDYPWRGDAIDNARYRLRNIFPTKEEAEAAIPRAEDALKGAFATTNVDIEKLKVWTTENDIAGGLQLTVGELKERFRKLSKENEQLKIRNANLIHSKEVLSANQFTIDGNPLSDGENALIRAFRNGRLCRQFSGGSSLIVEGHDKVPCGVATHREFVAFFMHSPMQDGEVRNALEKIKAEQEVRGEA